MCCLKFILLLLISSHISGDCQLSFSVKGGLNVCSGRNFTLTCRLDCDSKSISLRLVKEGEIQNSLESRHNNLSMHIHSANKNHSGVYSCQTEHGQTSRLCVKVEDCSFSSTYIPEYLPTVNTTSSSLTNTTYQGHTPSRILEPVLIWYMLFKTGVFLIISITVALIIVCQKH